jgi:hypothetical protein
MNKLIALVILATAISCNSADKKVTEKKDKYEQTKETLEETEKKNPIRFITANGDYKRNILGVSVVKGSVTNNAKVATYKDIEIEISFYSKTGAFLEKDKETVYEKLAPGQSADFKNKVMRDKGIDSVGFKVVGGKVE